MTGNGLFGSTTLDVVIGLIFVYLLLAIICTTVNEWIAGILKTRAATLKSAITQLLDSQKETAQSADLDWFLKQFNAHPLIAGLKQAGKPDSLASRETSRYISGFAYARYHANGRARILRTMRRRRRPK